MYDFLEDYSECDFFNKDKNVKFLAGNKERSKLLSEGKVKEEFNDFIFKVDQIQTNIICQKRWLNMYYVRVLKHLKPLSKQI